MENTSFSPALSQKIVQRANKVLAAFLIAGIGAFSLPLTVLAEYNSMLAPTDYTPTTYIPPKYDAFDHDYYRAPVFSEEEPDTSPIAEFTIYNDQNGLQSRARGTTSTRFTFDAGLSEDHETDLSYLEARWDFENDGQLDSYFSRTKTIEHTFSKAGIYTVKLEVLDLAGNISSTTHTVTVVNNTDPYPYFVFSPSTGTEKTIFTFDTSRSRDDQYLSSSLQYRFDWDGDGKWDTTYQEKTTWNHRFDSAGTHKVIMEVKDPGGAKASAELDVINGVNTAPIANFSLKSIPSSQGSGYEFNASSSSDAETKHNNLLYRWDFNSNGPDDIIYDTDWSSSDRYSGYYSVPGTKVIKLEVKDEDGVISKSYAQIYVNWSEVMAKNLISAGLR